MELSASRLLFCVMLTKTPRQPHYFCFTVKETGAEGGQVTCPGALGGVQDLHPAPAL